MSVRVHVEGGGPVVLDAASFVAAGGEGSVFAQQGVAYKVYADTSTLDPDRVRALRSLQVGRAVLPQRLLLDDTGSTVGFTMDHLAGWWPLARLFARGFRDRHGVDPQQALELVRRLADAVHQVHRAGAVIVDLNEGNAMADPTLTEVRLIDAASWQLPRYPATAVLDSVRDRHAPPGRFDAGTDWFSFAVVAFQLLIGIHPYRGRHPTLQTVDARMVQRVSALRPEVVVPPGCWPSSVLPTQWRDWFDRVLDGPDRSPPPSRAARVPWVPTLVPRPGEVTCTQLRSLPAPATWVGGRSGAPITVHAPTIGQLASTDGRAVVEVVQVDDGVQLVSDGEVLTTLDATETTFAGSRLLLRRSNRLDEVRLTRTPGGQLLALTQVLGDVHPRTELVGGAAFQQVLGRTFVCWSPGSGRLCTVPVPELDGRRPVALAHDRGVLVVVTADADGALRRHVVRLGLSDSDVRDAGTTDVADIEVAVLHTGVAVVRCGPTLELFHARPGHPGLRQLEAPLPAGRLVAVDDRLLVAGTDTLWALSLGTGR